MIAREFFQKPKRVDCETGSSLKVISSRKGNVIDIKVFLLYLRRDVDDVLRLDSRDPWLTSWIVPSLLHTLQY